MKQIFFFWTLFDELNPFYHVFKNWTLFSNKTPRIEPFFNTTQRFCLWKMTQKNQKFWIWLKELNFFLNVIQRFFHKDSQNCNLLFNMTHRIEPFCSIWLKELNHRTFSKWFNELNFLIWLEELNPFLIWPEKLTFFENESNNSNPFWTWFTELNIHFEKYPFFSALLKELNRLFLNMTLRFELFSAKKYDSKNWTLGRKKTSKKWNSFSNMTQRIELFLQFDTKNSTFFQFDSKNWTLLVFQYGSINWTMDPNMPWR